MKTILAVIGFLAVVFVGYTYVNKNKEAVSETADEVADAVDKTVNGKKATKAKKGAAKTQKVAKDAQEVAEDAEEAQEEVPAEPVDLSKKPIENWTALDVQADPKRYFGLALQDARSKFAKIKAKEAECRAKQKELARKVAEEQGKADACQKMLELWKAAVNAANAKYGKDSKDWVADFPYKGARTKKTRMKHHGKVLMNRAKIAQTVADRTNGANVLYESTVTKLEKKRFDLEIAIETLDAKYQMAVVNDNIANVNIDTEVINKYLDMSEVDDEMDGGEKALQAIAEAKKIEAGYDSELASLGVDL